MVNQFSTKVPRQWKGKRKLFQQILLDPLDVLIGRKTCPFSHTAHTHSSDGLDINVNSKPVNLLQGNTGDSLSLGAGKDFLEHRKHEIIIEIDQLGFVAIKNSSY